jgi:hypothetical protein
VVGRKQVRLHVLLLVTVVVCSGLRSGSWLSYVKSLVVQRVQVSVSSVSVGVLVGVSVASACV